MCVGVFWSCVVAFSERQIAYAGSVRDLVAQVTSKSQNVFGATRPRV